MVNQWLGHPDAGKLVLRLSLGGLILLHGINKLMSWAVSYKWLAGLLANHHLPEFFAYGVLVGEIAAPLMIIVGFQTRLAALIVVANMLFALYLAHMNELFAITQSGGLVIELQLMFLFAALAVTFLGAGRYAIKN